nr:exosortase H-associated membrane protein [Rhodoferax ferrireducens]
MRKPRSVIGGFFARALLGLVPALALWYWARDYVVLPVAWLADKLMRYFFPGWVSGTELDGINQTLITRLSVPHVSGRLADLTPEVSVLTYCYGLPLLLALFLAARAKGMWWKHAGMRCGPATLSGVGRVLCLVDPDRGAVRAVHQIHDLLYAVGCEPDWPGLSTGFSALADPGADADVALPGA